MTITLLAPDGVAVTAQQERQAKAAQHGGGAGRPLGGRSGFRVDTPSNILTATSTTWTLGPCSAMLDPGATAQQGMYGWSSDANISGSITPADSTYDRKDIVYIQVNDSTAGDGSGAVSANVLYAAGPADGTLTAPALTGSRARSFLVGTITVPKAGGGSPSVVLNPARFVAAGGLLPVDATQRDALVNTPGLPVTRNDVPGHPIEIGDGVGWLRQIALLIFANTQTVGNGMSTNAFTTGNLQPILQGGTYVGHPVGGSGDVTITYPKQFPNGVIGGIGFSGDGVYIVSATPSSVAVPTTSSLFLRFANPNGSAVPDTTTVRATWFALGW